MKGKILSFDNVNIYQQLAEKKAEQGDFIKSLGFLFTALKNCTCQKYKLIAEIAKIYSQMELYELSNEYWFQFLDIAPKSEKSQAYTYIATNFFYLDKIFLSCQYFHLKFQEDGKINGDEIDQEILASYIDTFATEEGANKTLYYLAYSKNKANFSKIERRASIEMSFSNFQEAIKLYQSIPKEERSKKAYYDLATCFYAIEDYDTLISTCKDCITYHGENLTCLCFICTGYNYTDRQDKFQYYYDKAVCFFRSNHILGQTNNNEQYIEEVYKLLSCAIEKLDNEVIKDCLQILLKDNPYDVELTYYLGVYYLNTCQLYKATETFSFLCKINPENTLYKGMLGISKKYINNNEVFQCFLPYYYFVLFPPLILNRYKEKAENLLNGNKSGKIEIKSQKNIKMLCDGILYGDDQCVELCSQVLSQSKSEEVRKHVKQLLLNPTVSNITKRFLVYALLLNGEKQKFGVVINNFYKQIKPAKFTFGSKGFGKVIYSAYSAAFAWAISWNIIEPEKVVFVAKELHKNFYYQMLEDNLNADEITAIILSSCGFPVISNLDILCSSLGIEKNKIKKYIKKYSISNELNDKGEQND